jgi:DNA mismatch endonuclease, patch repair protein
VYGHSASLFSRADRNAVGLFKGLGSISGVADVFTREKRSWLMARVRTADTAPELLLRRALWRCGLRGWRLRPRIAGRPDIVFPRAMVAVFVDGAFWHGHRSKFRVGRSGAFWDAKIAANVARDRRVRRELRTHGWTVVRCWDFEILRDADIVADRVSRLVSRGAVRTVRDRAARFNRAESAA